VSEAVTGSATGVFRELADLAPIPGRAVGADLADEDEEEVEEEEEEDEDEESESEPESEEDEDEDDESESDSGKGILAGLTAVAVISSDHSLSDRHSRLPAFAAFLGFASASLSLSLSDELDSESDELELELELLSLSISTSPVLHVSVSSRTMSAPNAHVAGFSRFHAASSWVLSPDLTFASFSNALADRGKPRLAR
jgi:hypothetical protein